MKLDGGAGGFTLVELMAVIAAAVIAPRSVNLTDAARTAALKSYAAELTSASAMNHALNLAYDAGASTTAPQRTSYCRAAAFLISKPLDPRYIMRPGAGTAISSGGLAVEGGLSACLIVYDSNGNGIWDIKDTPSTTFYVYGVYN
jgi:prepilin-type N-terminal cleavage/methylation domain-containing protein